jgi:hypothetical protein
MNPQEFIILLKLLIEVCNFDYMKFFNILQSVISTLDTKRITHCSKCGNKCPTVIIKFGTFERFYGLCVNHGINWELIEKQYKEYKENE